MASESMDILVDENLCENSRVLGKDLHKSLHEIFDNRPWIKEIRGFGLYAAVEVDSKNFNITGRDVSLELAE